MERDSEEFLDVCEMLEASKKKFASMTEDEIEKWDNENESVPVAAGEFGEKQN